MIHILDRQTERILDVLVNQSDRKIYWDTKMTEGLENNVLIFEFRMLADSPAAKYIIPKNKLTAQDQDGFHRLFIIDTVEMSHDANGKILFVSALGDHIELASDEPIPPQTLPGQTAETAVQFVLANTRYQPGQIDFAGSRTITFDTYTNPLAALQKIASEFELEIRFRVNVNPDGSITRIVDLLKPDSVFDGKEIVFGKDMTGIRRQENTENICTRLVGIGPADENGNIVTFASVNGGKIYVEDEEAYQRWNNAGRHIWGIFEYQPEGDTEVTPESLLEATKKEMEKRKNSAVEWEVSAAALEQVIGLEHERVRVGMNVRIKDEAFDPPIYLEARVLETEMPELDDPNGNFSYTFGNYRQVTVVVPPEVKAIQKTLFKNANSWTAAKSIAAQALADAAKAQATADGKITSFYQPDPPVTASEGDLWFDTDDGNKPYVWQNGQWVNAQDSGIAEALNRANDAQATADKKVQTFFSETQPTAEGIGDLWYNPASGALFRWSGSAWELVSDVTGRNTAADTAKVGGKPSITVLSDISNAQSAANAAQQAANSAQQAANAANAMLADISSDSKLTPVEKQATKKEWDTIVSEKPTIETQADTYGITTEKTNYVNAYNALNSYITPLLGDLSSTSNIDGPTFRVKFKAYYDARTALLKKITDLAKQRAEQAESNAKSYADQLKQATDQQIQEVQTNLSDLDQYVDGAFKDGVIQESEAKAIEKYLNQLNTEKQDIDARYNSIYNDTNLTGTAKTNLASAKSSYNTAHTNLVNSINSAIADGKVTSTEKADVDAKFSAYRSALATLSQRFEEAIRAIEQAKATQAENNAKTYTDQNAVKKGALYNGVSISETYGFKVVRSDGLVQGVFNATEGIRFQTRPNTSSSWQDDFYYDVNAKRFKFAGHLEGVSGSFSAQGGGIYGGGNVYIRNDPNNSPVIITTDINNPDVERLSLEAGAIYLQGNATDEPRYELFLHNYGFFNYATHSDGSVNFISIGPGGIYVNNENLDGSSEAFDIMINNGNGNLFVNANLYCTGMIEATGWLYTDDLVITNKGVLIYSNARHILMTETDNNDKQWHIEVNNGALNLVETNIATRLTLYPGGGLETGDDIIFSVGLGRVVADSSATYIQNNTEIRATKYKSTTYVPVRASSFPSASLAEYKEDIHPWQESALEKIRNTTIYEYYLKSELEQGIQRKRQGLVIGEGYNTPDGVVDGDGVEQYLLNAWSWKAIQELDSMQMNHEDRIATLEAKIAELEAKIS